MIIRIGIIIGGVNGVGKSSFTGVLKERTTDLGVIIDVDKITAEYCNGELRTIGNHIPNWLSELQNYLKP